MKKIVSFILLFALIFSFLPPNSFAIYSSQVEFKAALDASEQYTNTKSETANWNTYIDPYYGHQIVYGNPHTHGTNDEAYSTITQRTEKRYLGHDINGNNVTNSRFPSDPGGGGTPLEWTRPYLTVDQNSNTWSQLDTDQTNFLKTAQLYYSEALYPSITVNSIGGTTKYQVSTKPSWNTGASGVTNHYWPIGSSNIRYATLYSNPMGVASLSCTVSTKNNINSYTIPSNAYSVSFEVTVAANASLANSPNVKVSQIKTLRASYEDAGNTKSGQTSATVTKTVTLTRNGYPSNASSSKTYSVPLDGYAYLESIYNDQYNTSSTKTISLTVEPIITPSVVCEASPSPEIVQDNNSDINVNIQVKGTLNNCSDVSKVDKWVLFARKSEDGVNYQERTLAAGLTAQTSFSFTIPKGFLNGSDSKFQDFITTARAYFKDGSYIDIDGNKILTSEDSTTCQTYVWKVFVTPTPRPTPTPSPTGSPGQTPTPTPTLPPSTPAPSTTPRPNSPPIAIIDAPSSVKAGDDVPVSGAFSYDPDGYIKDYIWHPTGANGSLTGAGGTIWYTSKGDYLIHLFVVDNKDAVGFTSNTIKVLDPVPVAKIKVSGSLKENRKVSLDSTVSLSPKRYPLDGSKTEWTITPISGGTATDIKYLNSLTGVPVKDVLFKKPGEYKVSLKVTNIAGFSSTTEKILTIVQDDPPVADFSMVNTVVRDAGDSGQASIEIVDSSYSVDGDPILKRTWLYAYDSDNDGLFTDETYVTFDGGNNDNPVLKVGEVGKYKIEVNITEGFGQDTIPEFITPADYKTGWTMTKPDSEKIVEVINIAPVVDFSLIKKNKADLFIDIGNTAQNDKYAIMSMINSVLKPALGAYGIELNATIDNMRLPSEDIVPITNYYFSDFWNGGGLAEYNPQTNGYELIYGSNAGNISISPNGKVYFIDEYGDLLEFNPKTRAIRYCLTYYEGNYAINPEGKIYYIDSGSIYLYDPSTNSKTLCVADVGYVYGVNVSPDGKFYFSSYNGGSLKDLSYYDPIDKEIHVAVPGCDPFSIITADDNKVYYTARPSNTLYVYNPATGSSNIVYVRDGSNQVSYQNVSNLLAMNGKLYFNYVPEGATSYDFVGGFNVFNYVRDPYLTRDNYMTLLAATNYGSLYYDDLRPGDTDGLNDMSTGQHIEIPGVWNATPVGVTRYPLNQLPIDEGEGLGEALGKHAWNSDAKHFYMNFSDIEMPDLYNADKLGDILVNLLTNSIYYIGMGTNNNQSQVSSLIRQNSSNGIFLYNSNLNTALNSLATYMIDIFASSRGSESNYFLLNEEVQYFTFYSDMENDPKYEWSWKYTHDPYYFENSLGIIPSSGSYITGPITKFDKVGKLDVIFKARDNPKNDMRFNNYKLWSKESDTALTMYVHRKPVGVFDIAFTGVSPLGYYNTEFSENSYDLDHASRTDKGLISKVWSWKEVGTEGWISGTPVSLPPYRMYIFQLIVQDLEGVWSDPVIKIIKTTPDNLPPIVDANPTFKDWTNVNINATVTASDPGNDYAYTNYQWTKNPYKPTSGWLYSFAPVFSTSQGSNGSWYLHMEAFDYAGHHFYRSRGPYNIDKIPPTGSYILQPSSWTNDSVYINFIASDTGGSGVKTIKDPYNNIFVGNSAWQEVPDNGTYNFTVTDNAGNQTIVPVVVSNIDKLIPSITATPGTATSSINIPVAVSASDTGGSGIQKILYTWSASTDYPYTFTTINVAAGTNNYNFNTTLTNSGTYYLHLFVFDNAGNSYYVYKGPYTISTVQAYDFTVTMMLDPDWRGFYFDLAHGVDSDSDGDIDYYPRRLNTDIKTTSMPINFYSLVPHPSKSVKAGCKVKGFIKVKGNPDSVNLIASYIQGSTTKTQTITTVHATGEQYNFEWTIPTDVKQESLVCFNVDIRKGTGSYGNEKWTDTWAPGNTTRAVFYVKGTMLDDLMFNQNN